MKMTHDTSRELCYWSLLLPLGRRVAPGIAKRSRTERGGGWQAERVAATSASVPPLFLPMVSLEADQGRNSTSFRSLGVFCSAWVAGTQLFLACAVRGDVGGLKAGLASALGGGGEGRALRGMARRSRNLGGGEELGA